MSSAERNQTPVVVGKAYDLVLWLLPKVEEFPRSFRYNVGDRAVGVGLDLLLVLVGQLTGTKRPGRFKSGFARGA